LANGLGLKSIVRAASAIEPDALVIRASRASDQPRNLGIDFFVAHP